MAKKESTLYYFYSVGCGFCKKLDPIIDELIKEGHNILRLDLADKDNQGLKNELSKEYNKQCGTPWLIDASNGNQVCGYREKDIIEKWVNGEDIPAPPRPNGVPPRPPYLNAKKKEVTKWKKEYNEWLKNNEHLPDDRKKTADEILEMPRPKSEPPKLPSMDSTEKELEKFSKVENNENTNEEVVETTEEVKEEVVELSEEVEAAAKPITHNPENKKKTEHIQYSAKRQRTTLDRVMDKLSK